MPILNLEKILYKTTQSLCLEGTINRHALCVANGLKGNMKGVITQKRITKNSTEESGIDLVIVSNDMVEHVLSVDTYETS